MANNYKHVSFKNYLLLGCVILMSCINITPSFALGPIQAGTVSSPNGLVNVAYSFRDNLCFTDALGSITINTVNGNNSAGYTYRWLDNASQVTNSRTGLTPQVYQVEITDIGNPAIIGIVGITITNPAGISIGTGSLIKPSCNGGTNGQTNVNVSGGTTFPVGNPYTYRWTRRGTTTPVLSSSENFTGGAGNYTILVTDANSCTQSLNYDIENPPLFNNITPTKTNNVEFTDLNGSIIINLTGGTPAPAPNPYSYVWSFNGVVNPAFTGPTQNNLASGIYTVTVTDANGCIAPLQTVNIEPLALLSTVPTSVDNTCKSTPNGSIALNIVGGRAPFTVRWNDLLPATTTNTTRTGLDDGTYSGTITDALGAVRPISPIVINGPSLIIFAPVTKTDNQCFGQTNGTITLNVTGGILPYRYILNGAAPVAFTGNTVTIPSLSSISYTVSIIDAGNCATTPPQSVAILPVSALRFSAPATVFDVRCSDPNSGSIQVSVIGGLPPYTYLWSNDATNNTAINANIPIGNYSLSVTDALSCVINYSTPIIRAAAPITIAESALPGTHVDNLCFLNSDLTVQSNGRASITITGGTAPFQATWLFEDQPIPNLPDLDPSQRGIRISNLASGTYTLLIIDDIGCDAIPFKIEILPLKQMVTNPTIIQQRCVGVNDASITLNPSGGTEFPLPLAPYRYNWDSPVPLAQRGNSTVNSLAPGNYRVRIQDFNACPIDTVFIILATTPVELFADTASKSNTCNGATPNGTITAQVFGGTPPYTYKWSSADPTTGIIIADLPITPANPLFPNDVANKDGLPAGYYIVTVIDANLCETKLPTFNAASTENAFRIEDVNCGIANKFIAPDPLMSPNGDGANDYFKIKDIENFPDNEVIIYNRYGMEVFTIKKYNNLDRIFTGIANSALTNKNSNLVDGVYYYTIRSIVDKKPRLNKGYIIIKR